MNAKLTVVLQRDSVCAGDDCDAPHEERLAFDGAVTVAEALQKIKESRYLASIAGGKATWVATGKKPLAVLAQEWSEVRLMVDRQARLADHLDDELRLLSFRYLAQESPDTVFDREIRAADPASHRSSSGS